MTQIRAPFTYFQKLALWAELLKEILESPLTLGTRILFKANKKKYWFSDPTWCEVQGLFSDDSIEVTVFPFYAQHSWRAPDIGFLLSIVVVEVVPVVIVEVVSIIVALRSLLLLRSLSVLIVWPWLVVLLSVVLVRPFLLFWLVAIVFLWPVVLLLLPGSNDSVASTLSRWPGIIFWLLLLSGSKDEFHIFPIYNVCQTKSAKSLTLPWELSGQKPLPTGFCVQYQ